MESQMLPDRDITVSVVMAVYNAEPYVRDSILSVLRQSHTNLDIVIVDDCSTDGSANVIRELASADERIRLFRTGRNSGGPAHPRNRGIERACGDYVAFIDADDLWNPDKIEKQLAALATGKVMSFTDNRIIDGRGTVLMPRMSGVVRFFRKRLARYGVKFLLLSNQIVLSSVLLDKTVLDHMRFDEDPLTVEDYGLWLKVAYLYPEGLSYLDLPLTSYRRHPLGISADYTLGRIKGTYCISKFYLEEKKPVHPFWGLAGCILRAGKSAVEMSAK